MVRALELMFVTRVFRPSTTASIYSHGVMQMQNGLNSFKFSSSTACLWVIKDLSGISGRKPCCNGSHNGTIRRSKCASEHILVNKENPLVLLSLVCLTQIIPHLPDQVVFPAYCVRICCGVVLC